MGILAYGRRLLISSIGLLVAGCGGGGGGGAAPAPPPTAMTQTQSVGPSGGTVSTSLNGQTASATVPAGALAASGNVSITLYAPTAYPRILQALGRKVQSSSIGVSTASGASPLAEIAVDASAPLTKPIKLSLTGVTPASGTTILLAGYGTAGFDDVDTATFASGTTTEDLNPLFPGASLSSKTLYVFYTAPASNAPPGSPLALTVSGPSAAIGAGGTATFTAKEATP
ncbi:MAG TPA: hypothetical protein VE591_03760, partial [Candidatus Acidoferrum sp.]|nr:hypothetical protein [Candidatus Acidoferrum sp.]